MENEMSIPPKWRPSGPRSRPAALCLLAVVAALLTAATLLRQVRSQAPADLAADALPRLNLLGRPAAEAADYATQVKARYAPTAPEYVEARRRYEAAAERFDAVVKALAESVKENSRAHDDAHFKERVRLAVEAGDSFAEWTEAGLRLMRRGRGAGAKAPKADEVSNAASALARDFGPKDPLTKGRAVELMSQVVRFRAWDALPPFGAPAAGALAQPSPSPSPSPANQ
jgi:hypothetical protein